MAGGASIKIFSKGNFWWPELFIHSNPHLRPSHHFNLIMSLQPGQSAPDFTLYDTDKQPVKLSDQKGKKVVLLFFPAAFTSTCTKELCTFRDNLSRYNDMNAQVYGISVDMPYSLKVYKEQQNLNFPLLSDFNKEASTAYDTIYENWAMGMKGVAKRSAFVIDKEGKIAYAEVLENASLEPDYEAIDAALGALG
jgi:peroxiredoxin